MKPRTLKKLGLLSLTAALFTLAVVLFFDYRNRVQFQTVTRVATNSREILLANAGLLHAISDAEAGERSFSLTGREEHLQSYAAAIFKMTTFTERLLALITDRPDLKDNVIRLQRLSEQKQSELENTIRLRRLGRFAARPGAGKADSSTAANDAIRALSGEIETAEYNRRMEALMAVGRQGEMTSRVSTAGLILLVILFCLAGLTSWAVSASREKLIRELSAAKEALGLSLETQRATLYSIGDGLIRTDHEGRVQLMNSVAERLTGIAEEAARGRGIEEVFRFVRQQTSGGEEHPVQRILLGREVYLSSQATLLSNAGKEIPINYTCAPIAGGGSREKGVVLVFRVVSEREAAGETSRMLAAIIESSDDAIIGKTLDGTVTSWNRAAEKIFGYSAAEIVGSSILRLVPAERQEEMKQILARLGKGERIENFETERVTRNGRRLIMSLAVSPICDARGRVIGASKIARDITASRQMKEQLSQTQKFDAIGQLAAGVAGEFNNLLTVTNGYSALALADLGAENALRRPLQNILAAGEKAAALTRDLLALSRNQVLQPRVIDLNAAVMEMTPHVTRLLPVNIELRTDLDPTAAPIVADRQQIDQVIMNLIVNAGDAMEQGGRVTMETSNAVLDERYCQEHSDVTPGRYVVLAVTDNGNGIPVDLQARIFEPFFSARPLGKGTGLGLSTVLGIVRQSGGHISLYSEPGSGSTFRIYLPAATEPVSAEAPQVELVATAAPETILIVEHHERLREYTSDVLRGLGYRVLEAADREEALVLGRKEPLDLLFTAVATHGISGRSLAEDLWSIHPNMRVLFTSGYTGHSIVQKSVLEPGLHFLAKPFSPGQLAAKVREVLRVMQRYASLEAG